MNHISAVQALSMGLVAVLSWPIALRTVGDCQKGTLSTEPVYIMVSHNTRGDSTNPGPTYSSHFSYKAITEKNTLFYGGCRMFDDADLPPPGGGRSFCNVDGIIDVDFAFSDLTTATPQMSNTAVSGADFRLWQHCCSATGTVHLADVEDNGDIPNYWRFSIPMNDPLGSGTCACPPTGFPKATIGNLVLDMTNTFPDSTYEPPEEFAAEYQYAQPNASMPPSNGVQYFDIGNTTTGNVWIIQDFCECKSLFSYPSPLPPIPDAEAVPSLPT